MMRTNFRNLLLGTIAVLAAANASAQGHLVITEAGIGLGNQTEGSSSEYVEIYNPTAQPISLRNYFLSDRNDYKNLASDADKILAIGNTDNLVGFPSDAVLAPGQVAVVCGGIPLFLTENFGVGSTVADFYDESTPAPLLFEVGNSNGTTADDMVSSNTGADVTDWSLTNLTPTGGEYMVLGYYDGYNQADLVKDVDIVSWGSAAGTSTNRLQMKSPSDLGANGATYLQDTGSHEIVRAGTEGQVITRTTLVEVQELTSGGNGITGHDETTENGAVTWTAGPTTIKSPGKLGFASGPIVLSNERTIKYPSSSDAIILSAEVLASGNAISTVRFFVSIAGGAFTPVNATLNGTAYQANLGTLADNTLVKYYLEVVDAGAITVLDPPNAPTGFKVFMVDNEPVRPGDVVINEIVYDNPGSDTEGWEFVEIKNNRNAPVKLPWLRFADGNRSYFITPDDAEIPAFGYMIFTLNVSSFQTQFPVPEPGVQYYDWGTFGLQNSSPGDDIVLIHPNDFDYQGSTTVLDRVIYSIDANGNTNFPDVGGSQSSLELLNGEFDNSLPGNWVSSFVGMSPGRKNTRFIAAYISDVTRNNNYPAANAPVTITATVQNLSETTTVQSVRVFYGSGGNYASANLTLTATPNVYSGTIPGQSNGTLLQYYIEVTNSKGETSTDPTNAPSATYRYLVGAQPVPADTVVFNEILYNNVGGDSYEFLELFNRSSDPIDLSYAVLRNRQNIPFVLPVNTVLPASGYMILTEAQFNFRAIYGTPSVPLIDWLDAFNLNNTSDSLTLTHTNDYKSDGTGVPLAFVDYQTSAPWPTWTAPDQNPDVSGLSIELINPSYPDRSTNGDRWAWTTNIVATDPKAGGTPGAQNSVFSTAAVREWTLY